MTHRARFLISVLFILALILILNVSVNQKVKVCTPTDQIKLDCIQQTKGNQYLVRELGRDVVEEKIIAVIEGIDFKKINQFLIENSGITNQQIIRRLIQTKIKFFSLKAEDAKEFVCMSAGAFFHKTNTIVLFPKLIFQHQLPLEFAILHEYVHSLCGEKIPNFPFVLNEGATDLMAEKIYSHFYEKSQDSSSYLYFRGYAAATVALIVKVVGVKSFFYNYFTSDPGSIQKAFDEKLGSGAWQKYMEMVVNKYYIYWFEGGNSNSPKVKQLYEATKRFISSRKTNKNRDFSKNFSVLFYYK